MSATLRLHDTMQRDLVEISPGPDGILRFYSCGPTVHDFAHVGNQRLFTFQDVLKRVMTSRGLNVRSAMNVTDIDDKIIDKARARGIDVTDPARLPEYTAEYEKAFFDDLATLRIRPADAHPRATEFVPQMVEMTAKLLERGHAYVSDGSVYFAVASLPGYGKLSHLDKQEIQSGARVDADEYEKNDARDFVLWKAWKPGEPRWESPWGPGRPGWHLECSVMAMQCLGSETIDLHVGGEDLVFPHHENEIAQSEGTTGKTFCRAWVHLAHLRVDGQKMSKSLGNFYTLRDLIAKGFDPVGIRYFLASVHYRAPLNLTFEGLRASEAAVARLNEFARLLATARASAIDDASFVKQLTAASSEIDDALADDLNTSGALGVLFGVVRDANAALASGGMSEAALGAARSIVAKADAIFAFLPPQGLGVSRIVRDVAGQPYEVTGTGDVPLEILEKVVGRQSARKSKDFATADALRDELGRGGFIVEDVAGGARVRRGDG